MMSIYAWRSGEILIIKTHLNLKMLLSHLIRDVDSLMLWERSMGILIQNKKRKLLSNFNNQVDGLVFKRHAMVILH